MTISSEEIPDEVFMKFMEGAEVKKFRWMKLHNQNSMWYYREGGGVWRRIEQA